MVIVISLLAGYYILSNLLQLVFVIVCFRSLKQKQLQESLLGFLNVESIHHPNQPISILVPAYNEQKVIEGCLRAIQNVDYPHFEVIIVNDGSTDDTLDCLQRFLNLQPVEILRTGRLSPETELKTFISKNDGRFKVISQANHGKAAALNMAIDHATSTLILVLDADSIIEPDCLYRISTSFNTIPDLVGVGGVLRILNGADFKDGKVIKGKLPYSPPLLFQVLEYLRSFYLGRLGLDALGGTILLSGACAGFRKDAVVAAGGFDVSSITEDLELVVRIRHQLTQRGEKGSFRLIPYPICWTQAPVNARHLMDQRKRWQLGALHALFKHRQLFLKQGSGTVGWFTLPYMLLFQCLSPFVDIFTLILLLSIHEGEILEILDYPFFWYFFIGGVIISWLLSIASIHVMESRFQRHQEVKSLGAWIFRAFQFASASFVEMFLYHPMIQLWIFLCTLSSPFYKKSWGRKYRSSIRN